MKLNAEQLATIAMEMHTNHDIDWGSMAVDKQTAYNMMAQHAVKIIGTANSEEIMAATVTHLLVENFMLNLQLYG